MGYDLARLGFFLFATTIGIILIIYIRKELFLKYSYSGIVFLFMLSFLLLILGTTLNSAIERNWSLDYIFNFLTFRRVGKIHGFRKIAGAGYMLMIWGITLFIVNLFERHKRMK